jgi:type VI secretion system secreted protein VgrG
VDATHWIEIEVVDDRGKPVPGIEYRVVCPDGDVRWGTTGKTGYARETELPAGTCKVSFPGLDRSTLGPL